MNNEIKPTYVNIDDLKPGFYYKGEDATAMVQLTEEEIEKIRYILLGEHDCITLQYNMPTEFEVAVSDLLNKGYKVEASSCNSKEWKAIMVK